MKNTKKVLLGGVAALALVGTSVFGTYMYLTSTTETVTNTFTVGKVAITLDEAKTTEYGEIVKDVDTGKPVSRVTENTYKLIPDHLYTKDPTVHVTAGSETSWLFVKVENDITEIEAATTIAEQMAADWTPVEGATDVYYYNEKVSGGDNVTVFSSFKLAKDADVASYDDTTIKVTAYAVQADGLDNVTDAWNAVKPQEPSANPGE